MSMPQIVLSEASPERVTEYARLFAVVASLLGAFMLAVILLSYLRRRRTERQEREAARKRLLRGGGASPGADGDAADAWSEAGRRDVAFAGVTSTAASTHAPDDEDELDSDPDDEFGDDPDGDTDQDADGDDDAGSDGDTDDRRRR